MEFSNLFFLYLFFPLCVGIYFLAPGMKLKNGVLILFSLLFYSFGLPKYVPLLLVLSALNYFLPKWIRPRWVALIITLVIDIGILVFFKVQNRLTFPLGLSFYCFSLISYQVDIFRYPEEGKGNFWQFLLFVSFFPKMLMGPILRFSQVSSQLKERTVEPQEIFKGFLRFVIGLGKKILLADPLYRVYEQLEVHSSWLSAWYAGLTFMLYIYLEFSGYADMTLGLGRVFGFRLPENFYRPYTAGSVGEFWRRWHISLGNFFKEYVYIPLGGNRKGIARQFFNLFIVWMLTGLWHGVTWTFVLWGVYFFLILSGEKLLNLWGMKLPRIVERIITFILVYFGWVIFAAQDLSELWVTIVRMFSFDSRGIEPTLLVLYNSGSLVIVGLIFSVFGPVWKDSLQLRVENTSTSTHKLIVLGQGVLICILLVLCTVSLMGTAAKPSMYGGF